MLGDEPDPARLLVLTDDVHLPLGKIRFRAAGSAGGHNGLADLTACFGEGFARCRMGVGACPEGMDLADWVLSDFLPEEGAAVSGLALAGAQMAAEWLSGQRG